MGEIRPYRQGGPVRRTEPATEPLNARLVATHPSGRWETMVGTRSDLITRLMRGSKRGEYGRVGEIGSLGGGLWSVDVWRIREEPPRWRRPVIIAGSVLAALGVLAGLGWWAVSATVSAASSATAGHGDAILAGLVLLGAGALILVFRRPIVEVIVRVK